MASYRKSLAKHKKTTTMKVEEIIDIKEKKLTISVAGKKATFPIEDTKPVVPDVTITLEIEAAELYNLAYPPYTEVIDKYCKMHDGIHSSDDNPLWEFETKVRPGQNLQWKSKWSDEGYTVKIDSITYAYGKDNYDPKNINFFDRMALCGKNGLVEGMVKENLQDGDCYKYWINFKISNPKGVYKYFSIDPRLKIQ